MKHRKNRLIKQDFVEKPNNRNFQMKYQNKRNPACLFSRSLLLYGIKIIYWQFNYDVPFNEKFITFSTAAHHISDIIKMSTNFEVS